MQYKDSISEVKNNYFKDDECVGKDNKNNKY